MNKAIIIGKWLYPLTDELAARMVAEGKPLVSYQQRPGLRVFRSKAELEAQAFKDRTGFA